MDADLRDLREPDRPCDLDRTDDGDVPEQPRSRWGRGFDILRERLQHDLDTSQHCEEQRGRPCDADADADAEADGAAEAACTLPECTRPEIERAG